MEALVAVQVGLVTVYDMLKAVDRGMVIDGVRVLGRTDELARILDEAEPDEVTIAIPSASGTVRARVVSACRARGIPVRTLPTVFELLQTANGVGPRVAQAVLAIHPPREVRRAVSMGDLKALMQVPGIGRKGAERLVLRLPEMVR